MIRSMPLPEVLKRMSGDPARRRMELHQATRELYWTAEHRNTWEPTGYHTSRGARVEVRPWGRSFRWRLNGYASDGSDVA